VVQPLCNIPSTFSTISIFKSFVKRRNIQIRVVAMSIIFYCPTPHVSKWNGSWVFPQNKIWIVTFNRLKCLYCWFLTKIVRISISTNNFMGPRWMAYVFYPPQKSECPPFWYGWTYGIKIAASRSPSTAWPPYPVSQISANWYKNL
jgi:hypothetical protein